MPLYNFKGRVVTKADITVMAEDEAHAWRVIEEHLQASVNLGDFNGEVETATDIVSDDLAIMRVD